MHDQRRGDRKRTATGRLDLQATGSVEGDIRSARLVVADGAIISGKVHTSGNRSR